MDDGYQGSDGMSSESEGESVWEELTTTREDIAREITPRYWNYGLRPHRMTVEENICRFPLLILKFPCHKREVELWNAEIISRRRVNHRRAGSV